MPQLTSAVWLPKILLLLLFWLPGCVPLHGPSTVTGAVGASLSVRCQYEEKYKSNAKYWCKYSLLLCKQIVKTRPPEEARNGRVSIRDHPANLTFIVTMENLTWEDADTYKCGVDVPIINASLLGIDDSLKVVVFVGPNKHPAIVDHIPGSRTNTPKSPTSSPVHTQPSVTIESTTPGLSLQPRSLLSSTYFLLLVFLELPLLLSMLSAVLWVNRPQRCSGEKQHRPDYENQ